VELAVLLVQIFVKIPVLVVELLMLLGMLTLQMFVLAAMLFSRRVRMPAMPRFVLRIELIIARLMLRI